MGKLREEVNTYRRWIDKKCIDWLFRKLMMNIVFSFLSFPKKFSFRKFSFLCCCWKEESNCHISLFLMRNLQQQRKFFFSFSLMICCCCCCDFSLSHQFSMDLFSLFFLSWFCDLNVNKAKKNQWQIWWTFQHLNHHYLLVFIQTSRISIWFFFGGWWKDCLITNPDAINQILIN